MVEEPKSLVVVTPEAKLKQSIPKTATQIAKKRKATTSPDTTKEEEDSFLKKIQKLTQDTDESQSSQSSD